MGTLTKCQKYELLNRNSHTYLTETKPEDFEVYVNMLINFIMQITRHSKNRGDHYSAIIT